MTQPTTRHPFRKQLVTKRITVPGNFQRACDDFNAGRFFETHEWLEEIWQEERGAVRDCYKGLIQVAAAFVHLTRRNAFGSGRLLSTALRYLAPYGGEHVLGWDLPGITADAEDALARIRALGGSRIGEFDLERRPVFAFDPGLVAGEARRWRAWGFDTEGNALEMEITVAE